MIKIKKQDKFGYMEFEITTEEELELLPKKHLLNGSMAYFRNMAGVNMKFMFVSNSWDEEGKWKKS